jgi:hypothetical protein
MILYADVGTANLGDFANSLPVLSGLYKNYGKISLIIQDEMLKFNGIKEFLLAQEMFDVVAFKSEVQSVTGNVFAFNSWVQEKKLNDIRPIETCRYEILFKERYGFDFETDDNFVLNVPDQTVEQISNQLVGDRCVSTTSDKRRKCGLLEESNKFNDHLFLDYTKPILYNLNLIKNSNYPFITTVTGISVLVDLMNLEQNIYYEDEMINWDNRSSIQDTFDRHYYKNRHSTLVHLT